MLKVEKDKFGNFMQILFLDMKQRESVLRKRQPNNRKSRNSVNGTNRQT